MTAMLRVAALAATLIPAVALSQADLQGLPASYIAPNYDRVFVGVDEAHEAGAYAARTQGAAASWYNPSGFAGVQRTTLSVGARGLEYAFLSGSAPLQNTTQISSVDTLPVFLAVVLGPEVTSWKDVRVGLSVTQQSDWTANASWGQTSATGHASYVSNSSLASYVLATNVAWAVSPRLRLGASVGAARTRIDQNDRLTALATDPALQETIRTRLLGGVAWNLVPTVALQWDAWPWLAVGALARAPGTLLKGSATVQGERQESTATSMQNTFIQTGTAEFDYRYPLELDGAVAFPHNRWEVELDVRYHASTGDYRVVQTSVPVETVTVPPGGPPAQSPFTPIEFRGRAVVDVAVGGNWAVNDALRLHGGLYACPSPVASGSDLIRQMDLYGIRAGLSFRGERFSGSIGLGYETGTAAATPNLTMLGSKVDDPIRTQRLSAILAFEFRF